LIKRGLNKTHTFITDMKTKMDFYLSYF